MGADPASGCTGSEALLTDVSVQNGDEYHCYTEGSISTGSNAFSVSPGGTAALYSPSVTLLPGFQVEAGATFHATTVLPQQKVEGIYYLHTDHLGSVIKITDNIQKTVWRWNSEPFGGSSAEMDPDGDGVSFEFNLRFPGQYYDSETGLHYNYYRYYDPEASRYITSDPIGLDGGLNTYAYVGGNPLRYVDVKGLSFSDSFGMTVDWLLGSGPANRKFDGISDQVSDLKNVPAVDAARQLFNEKNKDALANGCKCSAQQPVTNYGSSFGWPGYMESLSSLNWTWFFVGRFTIEIYPSSDCKKIQFKISNTTSFRSGTHTIGGDWERSSFGPMGNMRQTYTWSEPIR